MKIWYHEGITLEVIRQIYSSQKYMSHFLGIEYIELGDDFLKARMPVTERTRQNMGILHGGASAVLAESVGSFASNLCVNFPEEFTIGTSIYVNHLSSVREGFIYGTAKPLKLGRTLHTWQILIKDENEKLVSNAILTTAVRQKR